MGTLKPFQKRETLYLEIRQHLMRVDMNDERFIQILKDSITEYGEPPVAAVLKEVLRLFARIIEEEDKEGRCPVCHHKLEDNAND